VTRDLGPLAQPPRPRAGWLDFVLRWAGSGVALLVALALAFTAFNWVIMPALVRHGKQVEVPDLSELDLNTASARLAAAQLAVRDTLERTHPTIPVGHIIDQDPPAGRMVKPGRQVELMVSGGGRQRIVPDIAGQTLRYARLSLGNEGYQLGAVLRVPSAGVAPDFLLASDPPQSTNLGAGRSVDVLVSAGPEARVWMMPDLTGRRLSRVEDELRFAGFPVKIQVRNPERYGTDLEVLDTVPPPGARVRPGDPIELIGG